MMIPEKAPPYDVVPLACCSGLTPLMQDYLNEEDDNNSTRASTLGYCFFDMLLMSVL